MNGWLRKALGYFEITRLAMLLIWWSKSATMRKRSNQWGQSNGVA